eukprot:451953_1
MLNGMNIGYLNAIRSQNNTQILKELEEPKYTPNSTVLNMTYKSRNWSQLHRFAIHCVHCNQKKTHSNKNDIAMRDEILLETQRTKIYHSLNELEKHFLNEHYVDYNYKCIFNNCSFVANNFETLIHHMPFHYKLYTPYYCFCNDNKLCNYRTTTQIQLIQHIESVHFIKVTMNNNKNAKTSSENNHKQSEIKQNQKQAINNTNVESGIAQYEKRNRYQYYNQKRNKLHHDYNKERARLLNKFKFSLTNDNDNNTNGIDYNKIPMSINNKLTNTYNNINNIDINKFENEQEKRRKLLQKL